MPKKFAGTNSKAAAAKAAKAEKADVEKAKKAQAEEDAKWRDDDKATAKKQVRELSRSSFQHHLSFFFLIPIF